MSSSPIVNYSFTDDSDEESELLQSNGDTTNDEDIPSDEHQSGQMAQQTLQSKWQYFFILFKNKLTLKNKIK